jgi:hypothetical protein
MCRIKQFAFFQTIGSGLLVALLVLNVINLKNCNQVNDFTGNCTQFQRALAIHALILTTFDVIIAGLGMLFAWQLVKKLRKESKKTKHT